jgi:hypothetical protein
VLRRVEVGLERVDRQHPGQPIADEQRDAEPSLDASPAVGLLIEVLKPCGDVRNDHWLPRLDHLARRIVGSPPVEAHSEHFLEVRKAVATDDYHLGSVELLDAGSSIRHHLAQLREDQIDDLAQLQRAAERLGRRA